MESNQEFAEVLGLYGADIQSITEEAVAGNRSFAGVNRFCTFTPADDIVVSASIGVASIGSDIRGVVDRVVEHCASSFAGIIEINEQGILIWAFPLLFTSDDSANGEILTKFFYLAEFEIGRLDVLIGMAIQGFDLNAIDQVNENLYEGKGSA